MNLDQFLIPQIYKTYMYAGEPLKKSLFTSSMIGNKAGYELQFTQGKHLKHNGNI